MGKETTGSAGLRPHVFREAEDRNAPALAATNVRPPLNHMLLASGGVGTLRSARVSAALVFATRAGVVYVGVYGTPLLSRKPFDLVEPCRGVRLLRFANLRVPANGFDAMGSGGRGFESRRRIRVALR